MPLNERLYEALKTVFRHVEITCPGDEGAVEYYPNWDYGGRLQAEVIVPGEYYRVSCPFCSDTRKRLYINYRWGRRDPKTGSDMLYLCHCFNSDCIDSREKQEELLRMIFPHGMLHMPTAADAIYGSAKPRKDYVHRPVMRLPEECYRIHRFKPAHGYLRFRGFDPKELWERWRIRYCPTSSYPPPRIACRIVIPVYDLKRVQTPNGVVFEPRIAGWQARAGDDETEPKYLTAKGMKKSHLLYDLSAAIDAVGPVVICEGVTDVWRLGTNAVALFGKDLAARQLDLILEHLRRRPLVIFLDNDAVEEAKNIRRKLRLARRSAGDKSRVVIAKLPAGRQDIGECIREEAWESVAHALGKTLDNLNVEIDDPPMPRHPVMRERRGKSRY